MNKNEITLQAHASDKGQQPQTIFVDGHKVTLRYASQKNPAAIQTIRDVLINSISIKKK